MLTYKAPLRELRFVREELLDYYSHYRNLPGCEEVNAELVDSIVEEGARFCESVVAPLARSGDEQGCRWEDGKVYTPDGYKEAYRGYIEGGWTALDKPIEFGGQGLPESLGMIMAEIVGCSNVAWTMYPGLSHGALKTIHTHGTEEQKQTFLPKLVNGRWTGTMCLTEAHCGTDLGLLRTRAEPQADGTYRVYGTKIFISAGEHDLSENIVHIVLARLPDAPAGTRGISLFIVPKFTVNADGSLRGRNAVNCGSIEKKMGIHGSATCVLNFDGAEGYLIGPPNKGLNCMFTFMNAARLGTAQQGVVHAEIAYQKAVDYAKQRLQMRALSGPKFPQQSADPIIVHPDVRRMLLTQRAFAEGGRALVSYATQLLDIVHYSPDENARRHSEELLAFLTPIAKAFLTESGYEAANLGMQCFGGHGYIREWGVEQNVRESRISTLYEGTTGVQALDLLARKVLGSQGRLLQNFTDIIGAYCAQRRAEGGDAAYVDELETLVGEWLQATGQLAAAAAKDPEEVGAASVDYLMYSGYIVLAYFWARSAHTAADALARGSSETQFYQAKLVTARFYFERLLPRTRALIATMHAGAASLAVDDDLAFA